MDGGGDGGCGFDGGSISIDAGGGHGSFACSPGHSHTDSFIPVYTSTDYTSDYRPYGYYGADTISSTAKSGPNIYERWIKENNSASLAIAATSIAVGASMAIDAWHKINRQHEKKPEADKQDSWTASVKMAEGAGLTALGIYTGHKALSL